MSSLNPSFNLFARVLATVIGSLLEVPLMLAVVKLGLQTRKHFSRKTPPLALKVLNISAQHTLPSQPLREKK